MGGTVGRTLLTLAVAALFAFAAVGCGGSDDDSGKTTTTAASGQRTAPSKAEGDDRGGGENEVGDDRGGSNESGDDSSAGPGDGSSAGEGSAAFRTKGGDNSIQGFGDEADDSEREAAEANIEAYLEARAKGDWGKGCEYLAAAAIKPLEQLAQSSPQLKGKGCATIIASLSSRLPASSRANPLVEGVASLRIEGDQGFALFHGPRGTDYFIPLVEEGGRWKVGALGASEFP